MTQAVSWQARRCFDLKRAVVQWVMIAAGGLASFTAAASAAELPKEDWDLFRRAYITAEGRVVDTVNQRVSHSEGQGYGMLMAEAWVDAATFELLWNWTKTHLQVRDSDKLLAWQWIPLTPESVEGKVGDINNASDGDVLVAWALYRASIRWERKDYFDQALILVREIRAKLLRRNGRAVFLIPGGTGFEQNGATVLNLSYWVFPAIRDFGRMDASPDWPDLYQTGLALLGKARFGDYALPSDWLQVSAKTVRPAERFEPLFSYNAIRIPLYLWWAGEDAARLYEPYADFMDASLAKGTVPASLNVDTNAAGEFEALPGMRHILEIARAQSRREAAPAAYPLPPGEAYYSASLLMLAKMAAAARANRSTLDQLPASIRLGPALPIDRPPAPTPPVP